MANVRIFQKGNNVQLNDDATGTIIALIPSRAFRFEPQEQYDGFVIRDYEARERVRKYLYSEALDEAGAPIGGAAAVIDYLAPLVGFNPAGGGGGEANTSSNSGAGAGLALPKVGVDLPFKSLVAGTGVTITPSANSIQIDATGAGGGEVNTSSNLGVGEGIAAPKVGTDLPFKSLIAAGSIGLSSNANEITITGNGEANTTSNSGAGEGTIALPKSGVNLPLKSLKQGTGITITNNATEILFDVANQGGEANTSSSAGGVSLVLPKSGVDLPFKGLNPLSTKISIVGGANQIDLDVVEAQIVHQNISGAGTNTHAQIDSHIGSTANPHAVTKSQVGLGNVTNDAQIPLTQKGAPNGVATLDATSKIPSAQLPAIAISETFVVASQAAQTSLVAQVGDVAVRTDNSKSYILQTEPASTFSNWVELLSPAAPVQSVNTQTGNVVLTTTNINEGTNLYYTEGRVSANSNVAANTAKVTNATHTGDVTGSNALTIANDVVSNSKLVPVGPNTVKLNNTTLSANPIDMSMPSSTILARLATGNIIPATPTQINSLLGNPVQSSSNVGTGTGLFAKAKVGTDLPFKSLKAGTGITIQNNADDVTINAAAAGEANTSSNVGTGAGLLAKAKVGVDLPFKSIKAGNKITVTNNTDDVTITAGTAYMVSHLGGNNVSRSFGKNITNEVQREFIFPGTAMGAVLTKVIGLLDKAQLNSLGYSIFDITNGNLICSASTTAVGITMLDLGTISNLPTGMARFQIRVTSGDGTGQAEGQIYSVTFNN